MVVYCEEENKIPQAIKSLNAIVSLKKIKISETKQQHTALFNMAPLVLFCVSDVVIADYLFCLVY